MTIELLAMNVVMWRRRFDDWDHGASQLDKKSKKIHQKTLWHRLWSVSSLLA